MQTRTATKANQLIAASARATLDPFEEIDWSLEVQDDDWFHLPPEKLPLFGTPTWLAMTEPERRTYSRHECAALCAAGIWFENRLMTIVLEHLADLPVTDPSHRYLLVEIADECRHSTMFGEYIRRAGTPTYAPSNTDVLGDVTALPGGRALGYLLILAVEELLDVCNRATMRDERVHPLSRQIAKLHVLEEARHMSFAKTYLRGALADVAQRGAAGGRRAGAVRGELRRRPDGERRRLRGARDPWRRRLGAHEPAAPGADQDRPLLAHRLPRRDRGHPGRPAQ